MNKMFEEMKVLTPYDPIFTDNDRAIDFMYNKGYRCGNKKCRRTCSLKKGSKFHSVTVEFKSLGAYIVRVFSYTNYQAISLCEISEPTYIEVKNILMDIIADTEDEAERIGGPEVRIQVDETAICNGLVVENPSTCYDDIPGIQWIVGGVVEGDSTQFFLKLIPDRKWETILEVFRTHIAPGSIIITDGYPSYPKAVSLLSFKHLVVNHSLRFVNKSGDNTNQIENLWSHLKQDYRRRGGVNHSRIQFFLEEFS